MKEATTILTRAVTHTLISISPSAERARTTGAIFIASGRVPNTANTYNLDLSLPINTFEINYLLIKLAYAR